MKRQEEIEKNFLRTLEHFKAFRQATIEKLKNKRLKVNPALTCKSRVNLLKEEFKRKEREVRQDLDQACRIWKELSERFRWWQKQELP